MKLPYIFGLKVSLVFFVLIIMVSPSRATDAVVGGACRETEFNTALNTVQSTGGGTVSFNCGASPVIIIVTGVKTISNDTTIDGGGLVALSGGNVTRVLDVNAGVTLTLNNLTVQNAFSNLGDGGAVHNLGTLNITNCKFLNNKTSSAWSGGAILSLGPLNIANSEFAFNEGGNGGALYPRFSAAITTITGSSFHDNSTSNTTDGWGGAMLIWDGAPVTVRSSQFIHNTARWGGAFYVFPNSSLTLTGSLLANNVADGGPSEDGGGGAIYNTAHLVLDATTVENNDVVVPPGFGFPGIRAGGALWNGTSGSIRMSGGALSNNRALHGGALYSLGNAVLTMTTLADNLAGRGGAIENSNNLANTLTINASTLSGNQVSFAIYPAVTTPLGSAIFNTAHLDITNSTLSGNSGSPALQEDNSVITLTNVTMAQNPNGGLGSDQSPNTSQVRLFNTLLAGNGPYNCGPILFGTFTSQNSLSSNNSCLTWVGNQNQNGIDPLLSPLGLHGGPTLTHMLAADSRAVDAGANCPTLDQRGGLRPVGAACDIGSVEYGALLPWLYLPLISK